MLRVLCNHPERDSAESASCCHVKSIATAGRFPGIPVRNGRKERGLVTQCNTSTFFAYCVCFSLSYRFTCSFRFVSSVRTRQVSFPLFSASPFFSMSGKKRRKDEVTWTLIWNGTWTAILTGPWTKTYAQTGKTQPAQHRPRLNVSLSYRRLNLSTPHQCACVSMAGRIALKCDVWLGGH